ncbi:phosphate acyltransferase [Fragilaria crotonensis]|nr:phosphate acyltransferase [Fragilaria crotonensis]
MASLVTGPIWMLAMSTVDMIYRMNETLDPNRAVFDYTGKIWSRIWLTMCMSRPTVSGDTDAVREGQGPCLYVANHASWLDIPISAPFGPSIQVHCQGRVGEGPCIGQQLKGGHHILIDREDRRSQLRTFKEGIAWLKKGVPLMAFPEGQRSLDGRLMDFKGGIFSMATKANVPIPGRGKLHIHIHKPINPAGKSETELADLVQAALLSKMPDVQHPLPKRRLQKKSEKEEGLKQIA